MWCPRMQVRWVVELSSGISLVSFHAVYGYQIGALAYAVRVRNVLLLNLNSYTVSGTPESRAVQRRQYDPRWRLNR